jgi:hypothetical protein
MNYLIYSIVFALIILILYLSYSPKPNLNLETKPLYQLENAELKETYSQLAPFYQCPWVKLYMSDKTVFTNLDEYLDKINKRVQIIYPNAETLMKTSRKYDYYKGNIPLTLQTYIWNLISAIVNVLNCKTKDPNKLIDIDYIGEIHISPYKNTNEARIYTIEFYVNNVNMYATRKYITQIYVQPNIVNANFIHVNYVKSLFTQSLTTNPTHQLGMYGLDSNSVEKAINTYDLKDTEMVQLDFPQDMICSLETGKLAAGQWNSKVEPYYIRNMETNYSNLEANAYDVFPKPQFKGEKGGHPVQYPDEPCRLEYFGWDQNGVQLTDPAMLQCSMTNTSSQNWAPQPYYNPSLFGIKYNNGHILDGIHAMFDLSQNVFNSNGWGGLGSGPTSGTRGTRSI